MAALAYHGLKALLLPPGLLVLLLLLGLVRRRWLLVFLATTLLLLLSLPQVAARLTEPLERHPALDRSRLDDRQAQAIVVLTGGRHTDAPEYGGDSVGSATLERLRYAAWLHRKTRLPVLVSGGTPHPEERLGEADLARPVLEGEFGVEEVIVEGGSPNTRENARLTQELLHQRGIRRILLVTHAWHMPRALQSFDDPGIEVIPAPTGFYARSALALQPAWRQWLPDHNALAQSRRALHEYLGMAWYRLLKMTR